ncbi:enoyl-CoA hydratase/isomerase family protein [Rhodococcus erythropolis]|uniref:enoyl-CoA hydratase/isomerase family protein n=1 Tax=Rhodococcus erythropolis TaxID=1833 RepID=UPI001F463D11|nr:enoyl-CoA hydratase/isomerase family protein [Rhodococcus erythropolis]
MNAVEPGVRITVEGHSGRITLNRPRALNALDHGMVRTIGETLGEWENDSRIRTVILDGSGERGLCAGSDIRSIYDDARTGGTASLEFWRDEYRLNAQIARFSKEYVAVMDGLVIGGGVGLSAHGSIRIVTERTRISMPETSIGFTPDVGSSYLLSRSPGELGTHAALTAGSLGGSDAIHFGLADYYVPSKKLPALMIALATLPADSAVTSFAESPPESPLASERIWIDPCFRADDVEEIVYRLQASTAGDKANSAAAKVLANSPTALKVTLRALRSARELSLEAAIEQEYRMAAAGLTSADFVEGIRAQIIDRDHHPQWSPATLEEVDEQLVDRYFSVPELGDLGLPPAQN